MIGLGLLWLGWFLVAAATGEHQTRDAWTTFCRLERIARRKEGVGFEEHPIRWTHQVCRLEGVHRY